MSALQINLHPRQPSTPGRPTNTASWRFNQKYKIDPTTGCWNWTAHLGGWGYGDFRRGVGLGNQPAHRWSFEFFVRKLLCGEQVHHRCENPKCVNPDHLEAMTLDAHNLLHGKPWGLNKIKRRCKHGHLLDGANLAEYTPGQRSCKACGRARARAQRANNPEKCRATKRAHRARVRQRKAGADA